MMKKELGKIESIDFGFLADDPKAMVMGVVITFTGDWGNILFSYGGKGLDDEMRKAKKRYISQMKNTPVEITFNENERVESWRVLTEVL